MYGGPVDQHHSPRSLPHTVTYTCHESPQPLPHTTTHSMHTTEQLSCTVSRTSLPATSHTTVTAHGPSLVRVEVAGAEQQHVTGQ